MTRHFIPPEPKNEPILSYAPHSQERKNLKEAIEQILKSDPVKIPVVIGEEEIQTDERTTNVCPHDHRHVLASISVANEELVMDAIENALEAKKKWLRLSFEERSLIFLKAAELLSKKYRYRINAASILCLSKSVFQAEIDSACELIDFLKFNVSYAAQLYKMQPYSPEGQINRLIYRPLEGFVFAASPFNFVAIAGNLATSPAIMGNVVIFKPASSAVFPAYVFHEILREAGLPPGVINFVPGRGSTVGEVVLKHPQLGGIHFTGSTSTFRHMWKKVGENIANYVSYPRLVGETGGKDFIFIHSSADVEVAVTATVRGAFELQGQKCSAVSRVYCPSDLWPKYKRRLLETLKTVKMGSPVDFENLVNAVIDEAAFDKIVSYINYAKKSSELEIIFGGNANKDKGYFVEPTVVVTRNPKSKLMEEEIFGPVVTIFVYDPNKYEETLSLCDQTSQYGLTGAILAQDREAIIKAREILYYAAGNFFVNDKPTGAVVGQQPFGGSRMSGTNDKSGSLLNLIRWVAPQTVKETFSPPADYRYPFMAES